VSVAVGLEPYAVGEPVIDTIYVPNVYDKIVKGDQRRNQSHHPWRWQFSGAVGVNPDTNRTYGIYQHCIASLTRYPAYCP
jgi:hypothetical protein